LTDAYGDLSCNGYRETFAAQQWASGRPRANRPDLGAVTRQWTASSPLRIAEDWRQALVEIDALVALMLGVTAKQLCTIYRPQFAVFYGHDSYFYDAEISAWIAEGAQRRCAVLRWPASWQGNAVPVIWQASRPVVPDPDG
jgi:hypothetical protein